MRRLITGLLRDVSSPLLQLKPPSLLLNPFRISSLGPQTEPNQTSPNQPKLTSHLPKPAQTPTMLPNHPLLFLLLPLTLAQQPTPTPFYINKAPGYSALPSCAERPLSTIVRGMARGCGDHNAVTSYDCSARPARRSFLR